MRITNNLIQQSSLTNIQRNLAQIHSAQERVSSGLRIQRASDDPVGAAESMRARTSLRALEQYRRGIQTAVSRATAEEQALDRLTGLLTRAREVATGYASDSVDDAARRVGQVEVEGLLREAISIANTRHDGEYLFGGVNAGTQPYALAEEPGGLDFTSTGPAGHREIEISQRQRVVANHNGTEVFEDTGVLTALRDLAGALGGNDAGAIRATMSHLDSAFEGVQRVLGTVGARANLLDATAANLDALEVNLHTLRSEVEEVDVERAITELVGRQTSFQAALLATSQVMSLTLTNYLR